jgi:hypothetical protein
MPIRINLLAEAQAAEDVRRRDPAKRAIVASIVLIALVLGWWCSLYTKCWMLRSTLGNKQAQKTSMEKQYTTVESNAAKLRDVSGKLTALNHFTSARFLQASPLDALMRASVDGIQILQLRTEQSVDQVNEPKPAAVEKVKLILEVKDSSANPGNENINKIKETIASQPYFESEHISTNSIQLRNLGMAQLDTETGKPYVQFTLECVFPDKVRTQ